jgi:hypothetical protein
MDGVAIKDVFWIAVACAIVIAMAVIAAVWGGWRR